MNPLDFSLDTLITLYISEVTFPHFIH